ncbi:sugar ABC transporter permease [Roseomonas sp. OT10]|uniref:carbohydrate ABC transporter permease n=1 Tax=Roseomonas cutis TaxID=2897332 RepID=UPI001E4FEC90|nr:sugar ABC transporter permease [Roseomonas sp. OT10]UFN48942.1 sugar ABC transporter permease [Roseomonas sp. OT10]
MTPPSGVEAAEALPAVALARPAPARARRRRGAASGRPGAAQYALLAPAQLLLLGLILLPAIYVGWMSLHSASFAGDWTFVGLANFRALLADGVFWHAAWNTFWVVNAVVYGEMLLGLGLALLLSGWMPCRRLLIALLIAPYAINEVSAVVMWRFVLEPDIGMVSWTMASLGLGQLDWSADPFDALTLAAILSIWIHTPFTFLILYAALQAVPRDQMEAATVDGAGAWQCFWHVRLPFILPSLLVALLFRYITAMRIFSEVWLLTEGGPARMTEVLAVYLYRAAFRYHEFGLASATGLAMLILSLAVAMPYLYQAWQRMFRHA